MVTPQAKLELLLDKTEQKSCVFVLCQHFLWALSQMVDVTGFGHISSSAVPRLIVFNQHSGLKNMLLPIRHHRHVDSVWIKESFGSPPSDYLLLRAAAAAVCTVSV